MHFYLIRKFVSIISYFLNFMLSIYLFFAWSRAEIDPNNLELGIKINLFIYFFSTITYFWKQDKLKSELEHINIKEAIMVVCLSWVMMILIGGIPYYLNNFSFANAIFESSSGFTTTGATIFMEIEQKAPSLLLWRASTQWLGGMGIVVFFVSIVPSLKKAGTMLFRSEMPGPVKESLTPHIRDTSRFLWLIYFSLTFILVSILMLLDLTFYEAISHAFSTLSTGGFSIYNDSIGHFSPAVQWVITLFMLFGGTNFTIYLLLFTSDRRNILKDVEARWYLGFIFLFSMGVSLFLYFGEFHQLEDSFRIGFFTIVSLVTTTGFANYDYELFSWGLQGILLITLFTGGSAGSTCGGVKFYRIVLLYKTISQEIKKSISPNLISSIKIAGSILPNEIVVRVFIFFTIYILSIGVGTILFILTGLDMATAFSAAASCVGNVGPGIGTIGPMENYNHFSDFAKYVGTMLMVLGRLEFFTIITIFHHQFWKEN